MTAVLPRVTLTLTLVMFLWFDFFFFPLFGWTEALESKGLLTASFCYSAVWVECLHLRRQELIVIWVDILLLFLLCLPWVRVLEWNEGGECWNMSCFGVGLLVEMFLPLSREGMLGKTTLSL